MNLVFLVEERSMKEALDGILPRVLPEGVHPIVVPHEGKSDLERSIPRKLRAWRTPNTRFVVLRDQDAADCRAVKQRLQRLCAEAGRPDTLVRVVCRELEAWFLGDLAAVEAVFGVSVAHLQDRASYRAPDDHGGPAAELKRLVPRYSKVRGAREIGRVLDLTENRSSSFHATIAGLRRLVGEAGD